MKIYTRTGDKGETGLFGGDRVPKDGPRIQAYGAVDELNSLIGIVRALKPKKKVDQILQKIQNDLFVLGADLATRKAGKRSLVPRVGRAHVSSLEGIIDSLQLSLRPLTSFILPGGTHVASHLHYARTVCRRAERSTVHLSRSEEINENVLVYLNRLSDLLFVLARFANHSEKKKETKWENRLSKR
ncbi:MAG: cob(I)yrinic acid a,c-diamide adenosyltransferase [Bacteroidota bacterium]